MNAKEYLKKNLYPSEHVVFDSIAQIMEGYHQAKIQEEVGEQISAEEKRVLNKFAYAYAKILQDGGKIQVDLNEAAIIVGVINKYLTRPTVSEGEIQTFNRLLLHYEKVYAHGGMNRDQTKEVGEIIEALRAIKELLTDRL